MEAKIIYEDAEVMAYNLYVQFEYKEETYSASCVYWEGAMGGSEDIVVTNLKTDKVGEDLEELEEIAKELLLELDIQKHITF